MPLPRHRSRSSQWESADDDVDWLDVLAMNVPHIAIDRYTRPTSHQDGAGKGIALTKPSMRKTDRFGGDVAQPGPAKQTPDIQYGLLKGPLGALVRGSWPSGDSSSHNADT